MPATERQATGGGRRVQSSPDEAGQNRPQRNPAAQSGTRDFRTRAAGLGVVGASLEALAQEYARTYHVAYLRDGPAVTPTEIRDVRTKLGLTQTQFAQLLGAHHLTVWKWEKGELHPTPHQQGLIASFARATQSKEGIGSEVGTLLVTAGVVVALYALLHAAFGEDK